MSRPARIDRHGDDLGQRRPHSRHQRAGFDAGIWRGRGRYRARCGAEVIAASLVAYVRWPALPTAAAAAGLWGVRNLDRDASPKRRAASRPPMARSCW
jgi:hypothetical protein